MLPCYACYVDKNPYYSEEINLDTRINTVFTWKNPNQLPPIEDECSPSHILLMEELGIPYIFDIHTHFFPEFLMKLIWKWFDKVNWEIAYRKNETERVKSLHHNKIKYFTTLNYAHKPNMADWLNSYIFENHKNWAGAIPFGTFYPEKGVLDYTKKAVEVYKMKGFKLHCEVSKLDLNRSELYETFEYLQEIQIPLVIHTGTAPLPGDFTGIAYFKPFIEKFPKLNVIVAHMGAYEIDEYMNLLNEYKNIKLDTTMVFVDFQVTGSDIYKYVEKLETYSDKILFGSDFPNIPYSLSHPITEILKFPISIEAKRKILYQNAMELFKMN